MIPKYARGNNPRKEDKNYPGTQDPHERDPGGNAIAPDDAHFSTNMFPSEQYETAGGGLIAPSVQDEITHAPVQGHDDPDRAVTDWHEQASHLSVLYDEEYGYAGLGGPVAVKPPYDKAEDKERLIEFAASSYQAAQLTRDVATENNYNTYVLPVNGDVLPILGDDWSRRGATVRALASNTGNILIGSANTLTNQAGAGAFVLEPGKDLTVHGTDSLCAVLPVGSVAAQTLCVVDEHYER